MKFKLLLTSLVIVALSYLVLFLKPTSHVYFPTNNSESTTKTITYDYKSELNNQRSVSKPIALETIFNKNNFIKTNSTVSLITTGDVMLGRSVNKKMNELNNPDWPFESIVSTLKSADITYINLESPFINPCPTTDSGMIFCSENSNINGLVNSGVDLADIANNHIMNYQSQGFDNTINLLNQNNILPVGVNDPVYLTVKGINFAFISFDDIEQNLPFLTKPDEKQIIEKISQGHNKADIVIVAFHWGIEYTSQPTDRQIHLAHFAIDQGADIIIGNHPHWIQPVEIYQGKPIIYSHGNLIFDQMWSEKTRLGIISNFYFNNKKLLSLELIPIKIEDYGQPRILEGEEKQKILDEIENQSNILKSSYTNF